MEITKKKKTKQNMSKQKSTCNSIKFKCNIKTFIKNAIDK